MNLLTPKKKCVDIKLKGAVQISGNTFFVFKDSKCTYLKSGNDEGIHKRVVSSMMNLNPKIMRILKKFNIKPCIDTKTLKDLSKGHMNDTCRVALGIHSMLESSLKAQIDKETIQEAAMLHDLGKVLIPARILNKPAKLTIKEREIMNIHSTLGYELLKTQNICDETLDLIKYHHQNLNKSGYPKLDQRHLPSSIGVQIISTADKYSALREARVYRKRLTRLKALTILYKEVREGKILPEVFDALVRYAKDYDSR